MAYTIDFAKTGQDVSRSLDRRPAIHRARRHRASADERAVDGDAKPEAPPSHPVAPWELRVRELRVFCEVSDGPPAVVRILAVGVKIREALRIGGEEIKL